MTQVKGRELVRQGAVAPQRRVIRERYDPRGPWECWTGPRTEVGWLVKDYDRRGLFVQRGRPILLPDDMLQVDVWVREPTVAASRGGGGIVNKLKNIIQR